MDNCAELFAAHNRRMLLMFNQTKKTTIMKELKFKFDLDCKFAVYVPSTSDAVNSCDNSEMVKYVMAELSKLFGGATASRAAGGWMSAEHGLILEEVTIVYAFCTSEQAVANFEKVYAICEKIKKDMSQEAVTLEYNGQVKFV